MYERFVRWGVVLCGLLVHSFEIIRKVPCLSCMLVAVGRYSMVVILVGARSGFSYVVPLRFPLLRFRLRRAERRFPDTAVIQRCQERNCEASHRLANSA